MPARLSHSSVSLSLLEVGPSWVAHGGGDAWTGRTDAVSRYVSRARLTDLGFVAGQSSMLGYMGSLARIGQRIRVWLVSDLGVRQQDSGDGAVHQVVMRRSAYVVGELRVSR